MLNRLMNKVNMNKSCKRPRYYRDATYAQESKSHVTVIYKQMYLQGK